MQTGTGIKIKQRIMAQKLNRVRLNISFTYANMKINCHLYNTENGGEFEERKNNLFQV